MTSITPSPEMVERGARAILAAKGLTATVSDDEWPHTVSRHWMLCAKYPEYLAGGSIVSDAFRDATACLTAALSCPDGFRLVPVEPTTGMLSAGESAASVGIGKCNDDESLPRVWRAMLAASPAPAVDNAGWRPIASFPKDGELYLVCDDRSLDGDHQVVFWDEDLETPFKLHTPDGPAFHEAAFTHWQPLPSAPSQDAPPPRSLSNKD